MHADAMKTETTARQQLACLGDASRYRIVSVLTAGQACVTELAGRIGLSQSCTTRHLQALERAGLVTRERAGRRVLFRVRSQDPAVRSLLDWKSRLENGSEAGPTAAPTPMTRRVAGHAAGRRRDSMPAANPGPRANTGSLSMAKRIPAEPVPSEAGDRASVAGGGGRGTDEASAESQAPATGQNRRIREELEDFLL